MGHGTISAAIAIQFSPEEILETTRMVQMENLDIRTITMGISLRNCADSSLEAAADQQQHLRAYRQYDPLWRALSPNVEAPPKRPVNWTRGVGLRR